MSHPIDGLPPKQRFVLEQLVMFLGDKGYPPSIKQLCELCGVSSTATMHYHLTTLKKKAFIQWNESERRAITLTAMAQEHFLTPSDMEGRMQRQASLPILGSIVAGVPLMPSTDATESLDVLDAFCQDKSFLLRVRGESMIEDHIADGDLVLVRPNARVKNGDIVVALVQGMETTLKRLENKGDTVVLHPANASMSPIVLQPHEVEIQGRVDAIIRRFDR